MLIIGIYHWQGRATNTYLNVMSVTLTSFGPTLSLSMYICVSWKTQHNPTMHMFIREQIYMYAKEHTIVDSELS